MPHLCDEHRIRWDETDEATAQARIRTNQARPEHARVRCVQCTCLIQYPEFQLCQKCAYRDRVCQQCSASTLTKEEEAEAKIETDKQRVVDRIIDDYTLVIKLCGRHSKWAELFSARCPDLELERLTLFEIDSRTDRPVWKEVLGSNIYRRFFCDECENRGAVIGFSDALNCPHLAVGKAHHLCHLCAARQKRCACCGQPIK